LEKKADGPKKPAVRLGKGQIDINYFICNVTLLADCKTFSIFGMALSHQRLCHHNETDDTNPLQK
jgi:hypothetical protein